MTLFIYTSEKVMPYVYYGVHKETGQFYFGSRYGKNNYLNKNIPSHIDLGTNYFTSSKIIKEIGFHNFNWIILAEFFKPEDALKFEEHCISQVWKHPLSLNYRKNCSTLRNRPGYTISEEKRKNMRKPKNQGEKNHFYGKHHTEETKQKLRNADYTSRKGPKPNQKGKGLGKKWYHDINDNCFMLFPSDPIIISNQLSLGRNPGFQKGRCLYVDINENKFRLNAHDPKIIKLNLFRNTPLSENKIQE